MDNRYKSKRFWKYNRGNMLKKNIFDIEDLLLIDKAIYNDIVVKIFFEKDKPLINNKFGHIRKKKSL
jgi:hypothetical protein